MACLQVVDVLFRLPEPLCKELVDAIDFAQLARPEVKALLRVLTAKPFEASQLAFHSELLRRLCGMLLSKVDMLGRQETFWWEVPKAIVASLGRNDRKHSEWYFVGNLGCQMVLIRRESSNGGEMALSFNIAS